MEVVAQEHQDKLEGLKESVQTSRRYNDENVKRYWEFTNSTYNSSLTPEMTRMLLALGNPPMEFNVGEAYLSRLIGEYSKQQPSIEVMAADEAKVDAQMIQLVEGNFRHALIDANKNSFQYDVYKEQLGGGFSAVKIWTDYKHPMSFDQVIKFAKCYDPTMTGFDPLARFSHKGDGAYAFEIFPMRESAFKQMYRDFNTKQFAFRRNIDGFDFSYMGQKENIILVCQFYEKKTKPVTICRLADGRTMRKKEYDKLVALWKESGLIEQPPKILNQRRTEIETIVRYRFVENKVLEYVETDFKYLPIIFASGNSALIKANYSDAIKLMERPYLYHAKDAQKLKNFAGQTWAAAMENLLNKKLFIAEESLPTNEAFIDNIINPQALGHIITKSYLDNNPNMPLREPREVVQTPMPPEISNAFQMTDSLMQMILGSYDASLGINNNQLSGVAIVEAATQSNAAAMPYLVSNMQCLNQLALCYIDLLPKYIITPRTMPIIGRDDKRSFVDVNKPGGMKLSYDENALNVTVEAGVSFAVQKSKALQQIIGLMQASETFSQYMNSAGLPTLLDNIECRGSDVLKNNVEEWQQQQAQQQQQMQQQAMQNDPNIMKAKVAQQELELRAQKMQDEKVISAAKVGIEQQQADNERLRIMMEAGDAEADRLITKEKHDTENFHSATELAIKAAGQDHTHHKELTELQHKILEANKGEVKG